MKKKPSIIYLITNTVNGKIYVGRTVSTLRKRWIAHKSHAKTKCHTLLGRAILKHGAESFTISEIESASFACAQDREKHFIITLGSADRDVGYNLTTNSCGSNGAVGLPTRAKLSAASKAYWSAIPKTRRSEMIRERMTGLPKSEEHCARISVAKAGGSSSSPKSSKFVGVRYKRDKWEANCYHEGRSYGRGGFSTEDEAAEAYDKFSIALRGPKAPINFEGRRREYADEDLKKFISSKNRNASRYKSVSYNSNRDVWCVFIKRKFHGQKSSELEAAELATSLLGLSSPDELLKPSRRSIPRRRIAYV